MPPKSPASAPAAIASTSAAASAAARCRRGAIARPAAELRGAFLVTSPVTSPRYAPPADYEPASHRRRRRGGRYGARAVRARGARARPVAAAPPRGARGRGTPVAAPSTLRRVRCRRRRAGRSGVWLIAVRAGSAGTAGYGYYAANWRRSRIDYTQDGQVSVAENAPGRRLRLLPAPADVCAAPRARSAAAGRPPQTLRPAPRPSLHRQECARVRVRVRTQAGIHMGGGAEKTARPSRSCARAGSVCGRSRVPLLQGRAGRFGMLLGPCSRRPTPSQGTATSLCCKSKSLCCTYMHGTLLYAAADPLSPPFSAFGIHA